MKHVLSLSALLVCLTLSAAAAQPRAQDASAYGQPQGWHGVLSVNDQSQFDKYYSKWVDATRKNDRDDISENARKMQEIMTRYNVPVSVSFDQVASNGSMPAYAAGAYPNGAYQGAYGSAPARLSADDQKEFDKNYSKWVEATRKNDRDDVAGSARKMQDIMARYGLPAGMPFAQVASGGTAGPYPNTAYSSPYAQPQRLSGDDQRNFDKAYKKWLDGRHKNHKDDIDENARKMQDIMARYNIPANVPFDRIASPGLYR